MQFRLSGERIHLDVDSLNEQLKVQGPDRLRCEPGRGPGGVHEHQQPEVQQCKVRPASTVQCNMPCRGLFAGTACGRMKRLDLSSSLTMW